MGRKIAQPSSRRNRFALWVESYWSKHWKAICFWILSAVLTFYLTDVLNLISGNSPATRQDVESLKREVLDSLRVQTLTIGDARKAEFKSKYPMGYCLFYALKDDFEIHPIYDSVTMRSVEIDWGAARIQWIDKNLDSVIFLSPTVKIEDSNTHINWEGDRVILIGQSISNLRQAVSEVLGITSWVEIIRHNDYGFIALYGINRTKQTD